MTGAQVAQRSLWSLGWNSGEIWMREVLISMAILPADKLQA